MALPIITAVRARHDLKESVFHTLIELAHRSSIYGVVRVSLRYLAQKCHCCKQTIINHLTKLIELKIISKNVIWIKGNLCELNDHQLKAGGFKSFRRT
jgi:CTP-dependent riboflavin kinase